MTHSNQWLQERADLLATLTEWRERAEAAEAKVAKLTKALEFYASKGTDFGITARAALKAMENNDE